MPKPKTGLRLIVIVLAVAALAYAGWYFTRPKPPEVELATIERGTVESTVVNTRAGTVKACRRAKLAPVAGGQIVKLWVKEGERVKTGQPLLELWNRDLAAQRELATRQLTTSEERRREACIMADNAQRDADRTAQLAAKGFVSPQSTENARADARARQANCDALAADVKRAQAQISVTQVGLERTTLTAPFAGIVAKITGEVGEFTTPSPPGIPTPPAVDLIDDSCLYVSAPMDEVDAPKLKAGQPARITLDALPGKVFAGHVRRIAPYVTEVEKQARTVDVEVDFDTPPEAALLVGYSADVEAIIEHRDKVLRVPTQAIQQDGTVLVLGKDDTLETRHLKTGLANWAFTEVVSGLGAGDRVLLSFDQENVKAGLKVAPKPAQP
ncbi:MAG: efflux RND transporter periplasmic adaptor subunit [Thiobacillus sp.]|uniref:efflux RND transporter periplasmic adaptor subunit n=1 Tax=unclassified Thiobacillus TaxID=2646513 RepID=UPI00086D9116|nr:MULTISPECIES: efflux RND transporter periplasmic adaptor subunit [unclassified Thiobacillus]MBN8769931.1 efflux RND transporter periplasmic adaptor subunit [Thiobacillus sp.]MBN8781378.1 efflux RND transporter periplasmic adaptor subunit [Thiobacillus sp.]ODU99576.1 MAG: efflux transporter periplasmic adaptor subunit [Thiobacillus sp. SCN 63-57]OJY55498.1 MAG: efflux transporter periplasmic adaptor subunit [Thiobacillus sp. 0-1251]